SESTNQPIVRLSFRVFPVHECAQLNQIACCSKPVFRVATVERRLEFLRIGTERDFLFQRQREKLQSRSNSFGLVNPSGKVNCGFCCLFKGYWFVCGCCGKHT